MSSVHRDAIWLTDMLEPVCACINELSGGSEGAQRPCETSLGAPNLLNSDVAHSARNPCVNYKEKLRAGLNESLLRDRWRV